jgi:carbamoyltransferase
MNTSFNLRAEPIVCAPTDAVRTFFGSGMDALVIGSFVVEK